MSWAEVDPIDLYSGQRVRQAATEGQVLSWRWHPHRQEVVVRVRYDVTGHETQWVVRDDMTVTAWMHPAAELVIVAPRAVNE
jgi:hypothetical protein